MSKTFLPRNMRKRLITLLVTLLVSSIAAFGQHFGWFKADSREAIQAANPGLYTIDHFVDGDTIAINMNGVIEKVRLIGIDTPETHKPNTPVQCYGEEAAARTKQIIGKQRVRLEADSQSTNRDRYDRLLRYVYLADNTNVNEALIREGYAFYYPYFPFTKSAQFDVDQQQAQIEHKGIWQACHPTPTDGGGYTSNN